MNLLSVGNIINTDFDRLLALKRAKPFTKYYLDEGDLRRDLYPKSLEFFKAKNRLRLTIAANRVGKTEGIGAYETCLHLTGLYPQWWEGKRFDRPVNVVAASHTSATTRDICQYKLFGHPSNFGTGLIPYELCGKPEKKRGVSHAYDFVPIKHISGRNSYVNFLSFDQGRKKFEGTERDFIWLDEEPPLDVLDECVLRTMTTEGCVVITFTPLQGMTETILYCLENSTDKGGVVYVQNISWDDVPHLSDDDKEELLKLIPPYQRDARSKGIPALGSGAVYPISEDDVFIDDFVIPSHYKKFYAMDVGWNKTACLWFALNADTDELFIYSEHYQGEAKAAIHAEAIKGRGDWIKGVIDPASNGRSQHDGEQLIKEYRKYGLDIVNSDNSVEAGIFKVYQRFIEGKLKIFKSCVNLKKEFAIYRRDEKGKIVKCNDHAMDAMRYGVVSGIARASNIKNNKAHTIAPKIVNYW